MSPALARRSHLLVAAYAAVSIVWGSTYFGIRVGLEGFPPFLLGALRFVAAGFVMLVIASARGERLPTLRQWGSAGIAGFLFFGLGNGLVNVGEQYVSSGLASVLVATMPLFATVWGRAFGERSTARELVGVALGLVGVIVLEWGGELRAGGPMALCLLFAPLSWALGSVVVKRLPSPAGGFARSGSQMLAGGVVLLVMSQLAGERMAKMPTLAPALALAYLAIFGSIVGFSAFSYLLTHARASVATSYAYVNPVIAVLLGVLFAGESFGLVSALGAGIILAALGVVAQARATAATRPTKASPHAARV
jgi:drug/metabolite transporter (DMT)-like permease